MTGVLDWLFGTAKFVPHGVCLLWRPDLVAIHIVSDAVIALSYFAIPGAIWWFVRRRSDLEPEHRRMAVLFVGFIAACGLTHVAGIVTLWEPYYGAQALLKGATAAVSLVTAGALPFLAPKLLQIPSPKALQSANESLQAESAAHRRTLDELRAARRGLEQQVADRDEDLRIVNARFTAALAGSTVTVLEQDEQLRYTWVFNSPYVSDPQSVVGKTEADIMEPQTAAALQALKQEVLAAGEPRQGEFRINPGRTTHWVDLRVSPTTLRDGRPGVIAVANDITIQKRQQEHLQLVMRELNHRSKNLLTIVQGIARQTALGLDVPADFHTRLGDRLSALAAAHDVLVQGDWRGANLRAVIESQLKHQIQADPDRVRLEGEPFELPPEMAHYLGLAVHELGANAVKYGALSGPSGQVDVSWTLAGEAGERRLRLAWRESGGPPVAAPSSRGFGRTILEVLIPRAVGGEAALEFGAPGVTWTLAAPLR